jgi:Uma2 family endonuclease
MAGGGENHNRIVRNFIGELHNLLKGKTCEVFPSDMRATTPLFGSYMYPDVSIVCGEPNFQKDTYSTLTNPAVIIEVTSSSTLENDQGFKLLYYLQIPSLLEYLIVDADKPHVTTIRRQSDNT